MVDRSVRVIVTFVALFLLYQSGEGLGGRLLGNFAVRAGLMLAGLALVATRRAGMRTQ